MKCVPIIINGKEYLAQPGKNLLAAAIELGVDIPHLCYDPRIEAFGSCRLCFIHLKGVNKPVPACSLKVEADMQLIPKALNYLPYVKGPLNYYWRNIVAIVLPPVRRLARRVSIFKALLLI